MTRPSLDMGRAFTFMFEEEEWLNKFLVGVLLSLFSFLILPALILQGYQVALIRRTANHQAPLLPTWDEMGAYLRDGLMLLVAGIVYSLPAVLLVCCTVIPLTALSDSSGELEGIATLAIFCVSCLVFLLTIPIALLMFAGLLRFVETGQLKSFFEFAAIWRFLKQHIKLVGLAFLFSLLAGLIGSFVPFFGAFWAMLASAHVMGQLLAITRGGPDDAGLGMTAPSAPTPPTPESRPEPASWASAPPAPSWERPAPAVPPAAPEPPLSATGSAPDDWRAAATPSPERAAAPAPTGDEWPLGEGEADSAPRADSSVEALDAAASEADLRTGALDEPAPGSTLIMPRPPRPRDEADADSPA